MSKTNDEGWLQDIEGDFPLHKAVVQAMPEGAVPIFANSWGVSAWTRTAKIVVNFSDGNQRIYFLKSVARKTAQSIIEGEFHSASAINEAVSGFVPRPISWGKYNDEGSDVCFFLAEFCEMDLFHAPNPNDFVGKVVQMHSLGRSPTGMFGFHVPTALAVFERTVKWEKSWAKCFANLLQDVINYDNETNGEWVELAVVSLQILEVVIPRLLGALQSEGRSIEPALIHGDLWEQNVGINLKTHGAVAFDPSSIYAHNEMEFGTWRCSWATHFKLPQYLQEYKRYIPPSEPAAEWDDRNRLYSLHIYLNDSAGHKGSVSRSIAYNDMLYLCEKYAPLKTSARYDPEKDIHATGNFIEHATQAMKTQLV